jgi:hypothetical protein
MFGTLVTLPFLARGRNPELGRLMAAGMAAAAVWWFITLTADPLRDAVWRALREVVGPGSLHDPTVVAAVSAALVLGAIGLAAFRRERYPVLWRSAALGMVLFAAGWWLLTISAAPDGDSLWRWVRYLPGGRAVRVVSRVYVVVYLFGSLAALAWLDRVALSIPWAAGRVALLSAVGGFLIWEQTGVKTPSFPRADFYPLVDRAAADLRGAEVGYLMPRYHDPHGESLNMAAGEVFAMWVGMRANVPVVNGYSGVLPPGYLPFALLTDDQLRACMAPKCAGRVVIRVIDPDIPGRSHDVVIE